MHNRICSFLGKSPLYLCCFEWDIIYKFEDLSIESTVGSCLGTNRRCSICFFWDVSLCMCIGGGRHKFPTACQHNWWALSASFHWSWDELSATATTARLPVYGNAPGHDCDRILVLWKSKPKINPPFYKLPSISQVFYQSNKEVTYTASSHIARASKLAHMLLDCIFGDISYLNHNSL